MNKYCCLLILLLLFLNGCSPVPKNEIASNIPNMQLITKKQTYVVGEEIVLRYSITGDNRPILWVKNAYGTTIIQGRKVNKEIEYILPPNYSTRSGKCYWSLVCNKTELTTGTISIKPESNKPKVIETYIGPPSIIAGGTDYTMLVNVPTDKYDNPLVDNTPVLIKHQFGNSITETAMKLKNFIGWKHIYSPTASGRILVSASCNTIDSKELTTIVHPANASDFKIDFKRGHKYADGNQVIQFITAIIYDKFNNVISDGTLVNFSIKNTKGVKLQAIGTTVNGVARAKMLHPSEKETWEIVAYITGAAESNKLLVNFEPAVENYKVTFSNDFRMITVGPIKSFMNQLIPDGITINCAIYDEDNRWIETKNTTSRKGLGIFYLDADFYKKGSYQIKINSMGLLKETNIVLDE